MGSIKLVSGRIQAGVRASLMALVALGGCAPEDGEQLEGDELSSEEGQYYAADDDAGIMDKAAATLPSCTSRGATAAVNTRLNVGECLKSADGRFAAIVQSDGNFAIYSAAGSLWAARTSGTGAYLAVQNDGNVVLYASGSAKWSTKTGGQGASTLTLQNDGALVLRKNSGGTQTWTSGTGTVTPPAGISHVATTQVYDSNGRNMIIARPAGSQVGDLLVLAMHRTDDLTPLQLTGWTRVSECMKQDNGYQCKYASDCTSWHNTSYCAKFGDLRGWDLGQAVFVRTVSVSEASSYTFNLAHIDRSTKTFQPDASGEPAWATLSAVRGANNEAPVRAWTGTGCDHDGDSLFPSVAGNAGDLLLLSQSNDQTVPVSRFLPPLGTTAYGYVTGPDETAFLFGQKLTSTGATGIKRTEGPGDEPVQGAWCKDLMLSLTLKPR